MTKFNIMYYLNKTRKLYAWSETSDFEIKTELQGLESKRNQKWNNTISIPKSRTRTRSRTLLVCPLNAGWTPLDVGPNYQS